MESNGSHSDALHPEIELQLKALMKALREQELACATRATQESVESLKRELEMAQEAELATKKELEVSQSLARDLERKLEEAGRDMERKLEEMKQLGEGAKAMTSRIEGELEELRVELQQTQQNVEAARRESEAAKGEAFAAIEAADAEAVDKAIAKEAIDQAVAKARRDGERDAIQKFMRFTQGQHEKRAKNEDLWRRTEREDEDIFFAAFQKPLLPGAFDPPAQQELGAVDASEVSGGQAEANEPEGGSKGDEIEDGDGVATPESSNKKKRKHHDGSSKKKKKNKKKKRAHSSAAEDSDEPTEPQEGHSEQ